MMPNLYHWTTFKKAKQILNKNKFNAARWSHFIESENRFVKGSSWSLDCERWNKGSDTPVCIVIDRDLIDNTIFSIPASRTYYQTQGLINPMADPNAYLHESIDPDEEFVEGPIKRIFNKDMKLILSDLKPDIIFDEIKELAKEKDVEWHYLSEFKTEQQPRMAGV